MRSNKMRELSKAEQKAVDDHKFAREVYQDAGDKLSKAFQGYWEYLDNDDFEGAKNFLRPMPDSVEKILMFRNIIGKEKGEDIQRRK